jgi:hypothetical protein
MTKQCGRKLKRTGWKILGQEKTTMQFNEWKKDSNAQRKLYIFVAVLGLSMGWLYFGSAARAALRARSVRKPSAVVRAAAPVAVTPPPPAPVVVAAPPPPPPSPEEVQAAELAKLAGTVWGGSVPVPNIGICEIRLELKNSEEKNSEGRPGFTGYSTMSCANVAAALRPGRRNTNGQDPNKTLAELVPMSAILSGEIKNGKIELHQVQAIGARDGCNVTGASLVLFGDANMAVTWTEGPLASCVGGQVVMHKVRSL